VFSVKIGAVPIGGLLNAYAGQPGNYTDCFTLDIPKMVTLREFILVFFNTPVFRLERLLLGLFASRPSVREDVIDLASGASDTLAAWKVESRNKNQMLLAVGGGPIRTWLMVEQHPYNSGTSRLYFGSAVLAVEQGPNAKLKIGKMFRLMLGFHNFYSRLLLWLTAWQLQK